MGNISIEEQIILYEEGASIGQIAARLGVAKSTISRRFARYGVARRTQPEAIYLSIAQTGKHGGRPREYTRDETFFDTLTPVSAYIIGFIQADGTIGPDRFSIAASVIDAEFLVTLASCMGSNRPLQEVQHPLGRVARLVINSSKMAASLQNWGIHSPRTWTASTHPDLLLNRDYWRGVIDGDGTICVSKSGKRIMRLVGSHDICQQFLDFARHHGHGFGAKVCNDRNIFAVTLSWHQAIAIARVLYQDAPLFLPRKMDIYLKYFSVQRSGKAC